LLLVDRFLSQFVILILVDFAAHDEPTVFFFHLELLFDGLAVAVMLSTALLLEFAFDLIEPEVQFVLLVFDRSHFLGHLLLLEFVL